MKKRTFCDIVYAVTGIRPKRKPKKCCVPPCDSGGGNGGDPVYTSPPRFRTLQEVNTIAHPAVVNELNPWFYFIDMFKGNTVGQPQNGFNNGTSEIYSPDVREDKTIADIKWGWTIINPSGFFLTSSSSPFLYFNGALDFQIEAVMYTALPYNSPETSITIDIWYGGEEYNKRSAKIIIQNPNLL